MFRDPFRGDPNKLVMCAAYNTDNTPAKSNYREECSKLMEAVAD